jgi:hypothetical protein
MQATDSSAAYQMFDALYDMLEEYEYDTEQHASCGMDTRTQRDIIERARDAMNAFSPGCITSQPYWKEVSDAQGDS